MGNSLSLPPYFTILIIAILFTVFLVAKHCRSKRKLSSHDFFTSIAQALLAGGAIIIGVNFIGLWALGELELPHTLIDPAGPELTIGFFLVSLALWIVYSNLFEKR
jgi:uncharacterized membrane protein YiaA